MPTRRLAAVLFADIVGYTAMMQQNETEGMAKAQTFRNQVPQLVQDHQGEVIEIRGDGALCLFNSAAEATACAQQIQVELGADIPLRIGIHLGDVMQHSDHIMGDAVNIASRIESMGVAGAVLISSSIRQQIKNKPEFELVSLGKFAFKNVAEPMTVYALRNEGIVVPKAEQMKGKGDQVGLSSKRIVQLASVGFVAMALGAMVFWATGMGSTSSEQLLDQDIREAKVAVAVFKNFTGDENLDALGYMASEWISSGLRELKVRTVSSEMVRKNKESIGILPDNRQKLLSFAEITGAEYVVTGSFYLKEDSIVLNTLLSSTLTGEEIKSFTGLKEHRNEEEKLVYKATQYLMGYWAAKKDGQTSKMQIPAYEVYRAFLNCLPPQSDCYQKVLKMDSTFLSARIFLLGSFSITGDDSAFYKNKGIVEKSLDQVSRNDELWFWLNASFFEGKYEACVEFLEELYQLDTKDPLYIHQSAFGQLVTLNQPHRAAKRFEEIFNHLSNYKNLIEPWSYYHYIDALNRIAAYQKASDFYMGLSEKIKTMLLDRSARYAVIALIYQNRIEEAIRIIEERGSRKEEFLQAAFIYNYIFPAKDNPFKALLIEKVDQFEDKLLLNWEGIRLFDWKTKATVYYVLGDFEQAKEALLKMDKPHTYNRTKGYTSFPENQYWEKLWHTAMLGCVYARTGAIAKAEKQIIELEGLRQLYPDTHATFNRGTTPYLIARVYAELGEKELALQYLQESVKQGRPFAYMSFTADMYLVNLKGYPPFEELIRPKG